MSKFLNLVKTFYLPGGYLDLDDPGVVRSGSTSSIQIYRGLGSQTSGRETTCHVVSGFLTPIWRFMARKIRSLVLREDLLRPLQVTVENLGVAAEKSAAHAPEVFKYRRGGVFIQ